MVLQGPYITRLAHLQRQEDSDQDQWQLQAETLASQPPHILVSQPDPLARGEWLGFLA